MSEQTGENDACRHHHGRSPVQLLGDNGVLGPTFCAVHATHLSDDDVIEQARPIYAHRTAKNRLGPST